MGDRRGIACRTWEPMWTDEWQQYSYDRGVYEGAAILNGLIGMAIGIQANHDPWFHCKRCRSSSLNSGGKCLNCDEDCASDTTGETR